MSIRRLAIVNRGEPAIRALAAVAELNSSRTSGRITTVAVHTDADIQAWFVRAADEAISLGPASYVDPVDGTRRSRYLDEAAVIAAIREAGADAVWVGWGFLAERASFAQSCEEAGITFVGPDSSTIRRLGDKMAAKRLAESVDVPVVPWSGEEVDRPDRAAEHARRLGYPLLIKAAAGGGGRGIRVVQRRPELATALGSARAEAALAFGDPTVFLERFVPARRHVEVQIIADNYGTIWAAGVRDCTIQRRHQKLIEESSSPLLDRATEKAITDAAVRIAAAASYRNAGTVEFLVDPASREFMFMEVNARLQVEHPVTEATTGLDLVKLQLYVADGGRLRGRPPVRRGHAIEARLCAEDPETLAPSPGRLAVFATPTGPGIRIDSGFREGDVVAPDFDSMIAKIVAWGRDRPEALARLRRALAQTTAVVEGGGTNRCLLLALLDSQDMRDAQVDVDWLDRLTSTRAHLPAPDPVALLHAAVHAYEAEHAVTTAAFHARAARGQPEAPGEVGYACKLSYRGVRYDLRVFRTGPCSYRVAAGGTLADIAVERLNAYECRVDVGGRRHRVVTVVDGPSLRIDVDDTTHRVSRDDGGVVRSAWPAFVASVRVKPGDVVAPGDPLMVVESMKMEATITAPFGGEVESVEVSANAQIDAGAPLLRLRPRPRADTSGAADALDLRGLTATEAADTPPCQRVYSSLCGYLLGYDLDPATLRGLLTRQRRMCETAPPTDPGLMTCEDGLLDLFADVGWLYRPRTESEPDGPLAPGGTQEYLLSYLQWLDADRAGLPSHYRERLARALHRYGIQGLERSAELEEAVVWMYRSFSRVRELVPSVLAILERRLRHRDALVHLAGAPMRARLDRLASAAQGRYQVVADLAREVRFGYLDEPILSRVTLDEYSTVESHLDALATDPGRSDRAAQLDRLVESPEPLRATLLRRWLSTCDERFRRVLLEVYSRRYYRIRELRELSCGTWAGQLICSAEYELDGRQIHLVVGYTPIAELPAWSAAVQAHLAGARPDDGEAVAAVQPNREIVVDVTAWRECEGLVGDPLVAELTERLGGCEFGRPLRRIDLTLATTSGPAAYGRARHVTFRQTDDGALVEERLYRDMHPMLAKRLALWRLGNFDLVRLPSTEDVYLFHGVARDNPADRRLFALAEVRDLIPVPGPLDEAATITYPRLELMGVRALSAMRLALTQFSERDRPAANRIILEVRPPWTVPPEVWPGWARSLAPLAVGAGLEKVVLRVRIPEPAGTRDAVLHVSGLGGHGVTVRERPVGDAMIRSLTPYRQKVLRAQRFGAPYPYELIRLLAPPAGVVGRFPTGSFTEYDLDDSGALVPVERLPGLNTANVVVGVIVNDTTKVPEGMSRVVVLGDPTNGLGNLAEPECRRIIAALDLAERLRVPVEWFALSSGARIAMDSGTENMDWIAAVLRRLIEYTQCGGEVNVVVTGVNVGAQPYWNAEATMLQHTRGILVMTPQSTMVLTGKQALDFSGGVSAEDNLGIGGFDRVMGPNGQAQYWAPTVEDACAVLFSHYDHTYVVPGERYPRRAVTRDPTDRDVRAAPHPDPDGDLIVIGDVFSAEHNRDRKKPFDIRAMMHAVSDVDAEPLERWMHWRDADTAVVWDAHIGGIPVCLLGVESHTMNRRGFVPADGPQRWNSGTLFPQSSRKLARAINAASGNRPLVVLANLSGFDGSPESMRHWQLEYGAEIGRAVTNFRGPIVFVVVSRYHGGAFVVFSKRLNERMEIAAVEGSFASVIGGAPAAATVFARLVTARTEQDPRVRDLRDRVATGAGDEVPGLRARLTEMTSAVRSEKLGELAAEFDRAHTIQRALAVGSVDRIIAARDLRPYLVDALERGMARDCAPTVTAAPRAVPRRRRRSGQTRPAGR